MLVEARGLTKEYGEGARVVEDVSFAIARSETLGLVGMDEPNDDQESKSKDDADNNASGLRENRHRFFKSLSWKGSWLLVQKC